MTIAFTHEDSVYEECSEESRHDRRSNFSNQAVSLGNDLNRKDNTSNFDPALLEGVFHESYK